MLDSEAEIWRPIPGYLGYYEVSNHGRIRSLDRIVMHAKGPLRRRGMMMKPKDVKGYDMVCLSRNGAREYCAVHKAVLLAFPSGNGDQARHLDGDRKNNHARNLTWGTAIENAADRDLHGTVRHGATHPKASKSIETVVRIVRLYREGKGSAEIGRLVGLNRARVHEVLSGRLWRRTLAALEREGAI